MTNGKIGETQTIASKESTMGSNEDIDISTSSSVEESAILLLCQKGMFIILKLLNFANYHHIFCPLSGYCLGDIQNFPPSINLFLLNIISHIKANPPVDWPHEAYSLIMREDLALQAKYETHNIASLIKGKSII